MIRIQVHGIEEKLFLELEQSLSTKLGPVVIEKTDSIPDFITALNQFMPDLIITAHGTSCREIIHLTKEYTEYIPVIVLGCTEEKALSSVVDCMKTGAADYIEPRDRDRLIPSIEEALQKAFEKQQEMAKTRALERAGIQWRSTFDAISSPFAVTDTLGTITRANQAFMKLVDQDWQHIIGKQLSTVMAGERRVEDSQMVLADEVRHKELLQYKDRWFQCTREKITSPEDEFIEKFYLYEDITTPLELERNLRESEQRYHSFFETVSLGILYLDSTSIILDANKAACAILGFAREELIKKDPEDVKLGPIIAPIASFRAGLDFIMVKDRLCSVLRNSDQKRIWLKTSIEPVYGDTKGSISKFYVLFENISEQKKIQEDLLNSEIRYHQLLEVAPVGVLVLTGNHIKYCNTQGAFILGAKESETLIGINFDTLLIQEEIHSTHERLDKLRSGSTIEYPLDTKYKRLDGSLVDVEVVGSKTRYAEENAELIIITDITSRKQAERIRRNNEAQLRAIFQSAPLTMMVVDRNLRVRNINTPNEERELDLESRLHICEGDIINCTYYEKGGHCSKCALRRTVENTIDTGREVKNLEAEMSIIQDGEQVKKTYLLHGSRINYFEENLCLIILNDITDIKHTQNELARTVSALKLSQKKNLQHSQWINALYEASRKIVACNDVKTLLTTVMKFLEKHFSFLAASVVFPSSTQGRYIIQAVSRRGQNINKRVGIIPGESFEITQIPPFFRAFNPGRVETLSLQESETIPSEFWNKRLKAFTHEGLNFIVKISFPAEKDNPGFIFLEYGEPVHFTKNESVFLYEMADLVGMALENLMLYKELKLSYENLEAAQQRIEKQRRMEAMGQVASGIAHDINNTLVPLTLYTEALLSRDSSLDEKALRYLGLIKKSTKDIENITSRLRSFYKGADYTELQAVDLKTLLIDIRDFTKPRWKDGANRLGVDIKFIVHVQEELPQVAANTSELREALTNLIFNAADALPEGGTIKLSARAEGPNVAIIVSDTGVGMSEETLEHCFEPFFSTKGVTGTGLGLSEVYGTIQRFKGSIDIKSRIGKGTTITISLPISAAATALEVPAERGNPTNSYRILLLDDDERVLTALHETLRLEGNKVQPYSSAKKALSFLKNKTNIIDLVISDLGMPEMDGNSFAEEVKKIRPETPVILMTGWGKLLSSKDKSKYVDRIISKPPNLDKLHTIMAELTGNH